MDSNILVYAHRADTQQHGQAHALLKRLATAAAPWAIPVFALGEFIRVVTHPRVFSPPSRADRVISNLDRLLASPSVRIISPGVRYWSLLQDAVRDANATGNLIFDAQIAAVCREHGIDRLVTEDRDFRRFTGVRAVRLADA